MDGDAASDDDAAGDGGDRSDGGDPEGTLDGLDVALAHWRIAARGGAEAVDDSDEIRGAYLDVEFSDVLADTAFEPGGRLQTRVDRVFEYALLEDVDWTVYAPPTCCSPPARRPGR
jgi:hypothetical protein